MKAGRLICIGSPQLLKRKFGKEYIVSVDKPEDKEGLLRAVNDLGNNVVVIADTPSVLKFSVPIRDGLKLSSVLKLMHRMHQKGQFSRFAVSQLSLTDTFNRIVRTSEN
jgi:hypothetical protein